MIASISTAIESKDNESSRHTYTLLIFPDSCDGQNSIGFAQPASVELVIGHNEPEQKSKESSEQAED